MGGHVITERIGRVNGRIRSTLPRKAVAIDGSVAVVIISHNYGRFLAEAIRSAQDQTHKPAEIVVIDDSSIDDTALVARQCGVVSHYIAAGNVFEARKKGLEVTESDYLCFLDADDILPAEYLRLGLREFSDYRVGVVYSDMQMFGNQNGIISQPEFNLDELQKDNFIHAGSLARREALISSRAYEKEVSQQVTADWTVWKRMCSQGWLGKKQPALYLYRKHGSSMMDNRKEGSDYFGRAMLGQESVTFFLALSGRTRYWKRMAKFLDRQTWPKDQVRLFLMDSSRSPRFNKKLYSWSASSGYNDVRIVRYDTGERDGVADEDRRDETVKHTVQRATCRIYNVMARESTTEYIWTIEDDVLPPDDACELLLKEFDPKTISVGAPLLSRYHDGYLHWSLDGTTCPNERKGVELIGGNGFGCTIVRKSSVGNAVFTSNPKFCKGDYDVSFYKRNVSGRCKMHWGCKCKHGG